jgi:hypothetical protein
MVEMGLRSLSRGWNGALALGVASLLTAAFVGVRAVPAWALAAPGEVRHACGGGPNPTRPSSIHLKAGLQEHASWIEFPVRPGPTPNMWGVCVDGYQILSVPTSLENGIVRFSVPTHFVNLLWLAGRLNRYEMSDAWTLYYGTCTVTASGSVDCV